MDKKLIGLMLVFLLTFGLYTTLTVFNKPLTKLTKAKEEFLPSPESSLIFAWPLNVKADGKTKVQVNVFIRNLNNAPVINKKVTLSSTLGKIAENEAVTDKDGKAIFNLTSATAGIAELSALVDDQVQVKQKLTIKFE